MATPSPSISPASVTSTTSSSSSASSSATAATTTDLTKGIVLFTTVACGHCHKARSLLQTNCIQFTEINLHYQAELYRTFTELSDGHAAVPFVVKEGAPLAGLAELQRLINEQPDTFDAYRASPPKGVTLGYKLIRRESVLACATTSSLTDLDFIYRSMISPVEEGGFARKKNKAANCLAFKGADLIVWMTNFLTLHPKPPTGNEWREVYARVDTEREPLVQRRPGDDPVSESIYLSPPRGARGEPDHGDADPHSENTPLLLCVELLNAGYFDHTKDSAASMTFTPDAQYALQSDKDRLALNYRRAWSGLARPAQAVAAETRQWTLSLLDGRSKLGDLEPNLKSCLTSADLDTLSNKSLEFQAVDLSGLSSNGLLAFFLNLYHVLHFHIRVTLGEPRSLSLEQRTAFFSEYGYVVNGDKYSLNDIEHGILRGNTHAPGHFKRQLARTDSRRLIASRISLNRNVHFGLINPPSSTIALRVFTEDSLEQLLQSSAKEFISETSKIDLESRKIVVPMLFSLYSDDFGASSEMLLMYIADHVFDKTLRPQVRDTVSAGGVKIAYSDTLYWDSLQRYDIHIAPTIDMVLQRIRSARDRRIKSLALNAGQLTEFPSELATLKHLQKLDLARNTITSLPSTISKLANLRVLCLNDNKLNTLPMEFGSLELMESLDLSCNRFQVIPQVLCLLTTLQYLNMSFNQIESIPAEFVKLKGLQQLKLARNRLTSIPTTISQFSFLELLDISYNHLVELPPSIPRSVDDLYLQGNQLQSLPATIGDCNLAILNVSHNFLSSLPVTLKRLRRLETLDLSHNQLTTVLHIVSRIPSLRTISLLNNPITDIPQHILESEGVLDYLHSVAQTSIERSTSLPKSPHPYLTLSRGQSITDLILAGSPELAARSPTGSGTSRSPLNSASSPSRTALVVACEGFTLEDGQENARPSFLSTKSSSLNTGMLLAHSHFYYRHRFGEQPHFNFLGEDEVHGLLIVSVRPYSVSDYSVLIRTCHGDKLCSIPVTLVKSKKKVLPKEMSKAIQEYFHLSSGCLFPVENMKDDLIELEEKLTVINHKVAVLYTKEGQVHEDEFYSNEYGSAEFDDFLALLGTRVTLKGWSEFAGGLDTEGDRMGTESVFTTYKGGQVMYHVSTLLPFNPRHQQQLERKCHLGNDIVMIVYQDGKVEFSPDEIASQFNSGFIVVRPSDRRGLYTVNVISRKELGVVEPCLPNPPLVSKDKLRTFILEKAANMEQMAWTNMTTFAGAIRRARELYFTELFEKFEAANKKKGGFFTKMLKTPRSIPKL